MEEAWHAVAPLSLLREGVPHPGLAGTEPVLLILRGDDVFACSAICPHKFTALDAGTCAGTEITCAQHHATFDLRTGAPKPDQMWAGRLEVYPVRVRAGQVEVQVPERH